MIPCIVGGKLIPSMPRNDLMCIAVWGTATQYDNNGQDGGAWLAQAEKWWHVHDGAQLTLATQRHWIVRAWRDGIHLAHEVSTTGKMHRMMQQDQNNLMSMV